MSYWDKVLQRRVTRRRGMAALGAGSAAAAFLAACGGDDNDDASTGSAGGGTGTSGSSGSGATGGGDSSGLLTQIEDTTAQAKVGGILPVVASSEPNHFDSGVQGQGSLNLFNGLAYSGLVGTKPGHKEPTNWTEVVPDLAESWEVSPDGLKITFKLRQGVKFANVAPVSGREFDAEDVLATWARYESVGGNKGANAASANPAAPIVSVEAPDPYTVVYNLNSPSSVVLQRLGNLITGEIGTMFPREIDSGFDPRLNQIGTGGFVREDYQPSVSVKYRRRPEYHGGPGPFLDGIDFAILPEYTARLAQFKAGNILHLEPPASPQDVVATKREESRLQVYRFLAATPNPGPMMRFGWLPINGQPSPFLDIRVRQAMSMSYDRDAFIDAFSNVSSFESDGLPVETYYNTSMGYVPDVTLDPRDASFGENAKYLQYNPEEARALIEAAVGDAMPEMTAYFNTIGFFGADHGDQVQVQVEMANEVGFKLRTQAIDYNLEYLPNFVTKQGNHEGIVFTWGASSSLDALDYYVWRFWSKSGPTSGSIGFGGPDGSLGDQSGDPEVDSLIEKGMLETDAEARTALIQDLQRHLAKQQYGVMRPGLADSFLLSWPAVSNYQTWQGDARSVSQQLGHYTWWLDQARAPFA